MVTTETTVNAPIEGNIDLALQETIINSFVSRMNEDPLLDPRVEVYGTTGHVVADVVNALSESPGVSFSLTQLLNRVKARVEELEAKPGDLEFLQLFQSADVLGGYEDGTIKLVPGGNQESSAAIAQGVVFYNPANRSLHLVDARGEVTRCDKGKLDGLSETLQSFGTFKNWWFWSQNDHWATPTHYYVHTGDQQGRSPSHGAMRVKGVDSDYVGDIQTSNLTEPQIEQLINYALLNGKRVKNGTNIDGYVVALSDLPKKLIFFDPDRVVAPIVTTVDGGQKSGLAFTNSGGLTVKTTVTKQDGKPLPAELWQVAHRTVRKARETNPLYEIMHTAVEGGATFVKQIGDRFWVVVGAREVAIVDQATKNILKKLNVLSVRDNVAVSENNNIYICASDSDVVEFIEASSIQTTEGNAFKSIKLPKKYSDIRNLQVDSSENFLLFETRRSGVTTLHSFYRDGDTWKALSNHRGYIQSKLVGTTITALNEEGKALVLQTNMDELKRNIQERNLSKIIESPRNADETKVATLSETLRKIRDEKIAKARKDINGIMAANKSLQVSVDQLSELLKQLELEIARANTKAKGAVSEAELQAVFQPSIELIREQLAKLSAQRISEIFNAIDLDADNARGIEEMERSRDQMLLLSKNLSGLSAYGEYQDLVADMARGIDEIVNDYYTQNYETIKRDLADLLGKAQADALAIDTLAKLTHWLSASYVGYSNHLDRMRASCPLSATDAYSSIQQAQNKLADIAHGVAQRIEKQLSEQTTAESKRMKQQRDVIIQEINLLLDSIKAGNPTDGSSAKTMREASPLYLAIQTKIQAVAQYSPEDAKDLTDLLDEKLSGLEYSIDNGAQAIIGGESQSYVDMGGVLYPRWTKAEELQHEVVRVDMVFVPLGSYYDSATQTETHFGCPGYQVITNRGAEPVKNLGGDSVAAIDYQYGVGSSFLGYGITEGVVSPPTRMNATEFAKLRKTYQQWTQPESELKSEYIDLKHHLKQQLRDFNKATRGTRPRMPSKLEILQFIDPSLDPSIPKETIESMYGALVAQPVERAKIRKFRDTKRHELQSWMSNEPAYAEILKTLNQLQVLYSDNQLQVMLEMDRLTEDQFSRELNGIGYIPKWKDHWREDATTKTYLAEITQKLAQQERINQGLLMLYGHTGTGKDVLVEMWCAKVGCPLFTYDCTRWTTEKDLLEKVVITLEGREPIATSLPSSIVRGIQVPGAMVYLNEYNAMPPEAQIALNALTDEHRTVTLKFKGQTVRAAKGVKIVGSMNPGYKGTLEINAAVQQRMVELEVGYAPFVKNPESSDTNKGEIHLPNEALRVAAVCPSLRKLTTGSEEEKILFNRYWNWHINRIGDISSLAPLSEEQEYDLKTIHALMFYTNMLRDKFMQTMSGKGGARAIRVEIPIEGRTLMRCGDWLGHQINKSRKVVANNDFDEVALELLSEFYLSHYYDVSERNGIWTLIKSTIVKSRF